MPHQILRVMTCAHCGSHFEPSPQQLQQLQQQQQQQQQAQEKNNLHHTTTATLTFHLLCTLCTFELEEKTTMNMPTTPKRHTNLLTTSSSPSPLTSSLPNLHNLPNYHHYNNNNNNHVPSQSLPQHFTPSAQQLNSPPCSPQSYGVSSHNNSNNNSNNNKKNYELYCQSMSSSNPYAEAHVSPSKATNTTPLTFQAQNLNSNSENVANVENVDESSAMNDVVAEEDEGFEYGDELNFLIGRFGLEQSKPTFMPYIN